MTVINNRIIRFIGLLNLLLLLSCSLHAQDWNNQGELEDVEIEIVKERQITLPEADRNFEKIPPRPADPFKPQIKYDFRPMSFQTPQVSPSIKPLKLKQEDPSKIYGGYVSAGYGNYSSPYLEGFINSKRSKNKLIGAHGLFSASDKGPVDNKNSGSGLTMFSVYGRTFTDVISLSGDIGFENRTTHFYGYPTGSVIEAKDIKQSYNVFRVKGDLSNTKNTDFSYKLGLGFSYLSDKFDATESEVDVDFNSRYRLSEESGIGVSAGYYLINRKDVLVDLDPRSLFTVNPRYEFYPVENLKITAGIVAAIENDSIDSKNVHAYPDIRASYPLSPSVQVLASLTGGVEKVSLQSLSNENLWVQSNIDIFHMNKLYDLQAGVFTKLGNKVSLNGGFSVASFKNMYFFVNDPDDQSKFVTAYSKEETIRSNFFASLGYAKAEDINIRLRGDIYSYDVDESIGEAWHKPTHKVTLDGDFNIVKKILLNVKLISMGGMKAYDFNTDQTLTLDAALDLNVRLEYLISDSFSVFAQLNNITNNQYPLYLNYPVRGFQAIGGLTWKF